MEIPPEIQEALVKSAEYVDSSTRHIAELESKLEALQVENAELQKKAGASQEQTRLVKVAADESKVKRVVDHLVKLSWVEEKDRDQVVHSYSDDPSLLADFLDNLLSPMVSDEGVAGKPITKSASDSESDTEARSTLAILQSIKLETAETR